MYAGAGDGAGCERGVCKRELYTTWRIAITAIDDHVLFVLIFEHTGDT
jgi:hypothetical protein